MVPSTRLGPALLALLLAAPATLPAEDAKVTLDTYVEVPGVREFSGRLIVRPLQTEFLCDEGMSLVQARRVATDARTFLEPYELVDYVPQTDEFIITVPDGTTENEVSHLLMGTGCFQYAEPDWLVYPLACPNDFKFGNQWHHDSAALDSCAAWDLHTGLPSVGVAICDTGVRTTHQDLQLNRREGYNAVSQLWESQGGAINNINNHGTITTGIAAANGNNGVGVSGVGWNLSHRMMRVTDNPNGQAAIVNIQHAARKAIEAGDRVVSISYAGVEFQSNQTTAAYIKSIGGIMVWAAGNDGRWTNFCPRDSDDILVVGAVDASDVRAGFSPHGPFIDLMAPGTNIVGTGGASDLAYGGGSGTSFATPLVAGLCALVFSANPNLTPDQVELCVKLSCDDLGAPGPDDGFGYGRINSYQALLLAGGGTGVPPTANFTATPLTGTAPLTVNFADTSTDAPSTWYWDFGDGNTSTQRHPSHVYQAAGSYTVTLTAGNVHGTDTFTYTDLITVNPGGGPVSEGFRLSRRSDFTTSDGAFLTTDTLHMVLWSTEVDYLGLTNNVWELKDPNGTVHRGSFNNLGNGIYLASFSLGNLPTTATAWTWRGKVQDNTGQFHVAVKNITVLPGSPPTAQFSITNSSGVVPLDVTFTDQSTGNPATWSWNFGDGSISTQRNPTHTYSQAGTYTVTLTVTNAAGSDTEVKAGAVVVDPNSPVPQGYLLSKHANFSTADTVFNRSTDTLHMLVWSGNLDHANMVNLAWQIRDNPGAMVSGRLYSVGNGIYYGSCDLSTLPGAMTAWSWKGKLQDAAATMYQPIQTLTILP